jgi:hypothetical protein
MTNEAIENYGLEIVAPAQDLVDAVFEFRAAEMPELAARARERGVKDPEAIIAAFQENTAKWQEIAAGIGVGEWTL